MRLGRTAGRAYAQAESYERLLATIRGLQDVSRQMNHRGVACQQSQECVPLRGGTLEHGGGARAVAPASRTGLHLAAAAHQSIELALRLVSPSEETWAAPALVRSLTAVIRSTQGGQHERG